MKLAVTTLPFILSGCSQVEAWRHPEIAACESYISTLLNAPTTYKRARAFVSDYQLPLGYWTERTKQLMGTNSDFFTDQNKTNQAEGGVRTVVLEYDASNGFGVPTRGVASCKFEMSSFEENKFSTQPSSTSAQASVYAAKAGLKSGDEINCCESGSTLQLFEKYQPQSKFVDQQVYN